MRRRLITTALVALTSMALPAAAAVGSSAADGLQDVWRFDWSTGEVTRDVDRPEVDLVRLVAEQPTDSGSGSSLVTLQLEVAADPAPLDGLVAWVFGTHGSSDVQTPGGYGIAVSRTEGEHAFFRSQESLLGVEVGCPGSTHRWIDDHRVEVTFDTACIRAPRSLPVGGQSVAFTEDGAIYIDYAPDMSNADQVETGEADPVQPPAFTLGLPGWGTPIAPTARTVTDTCVGAPEGRFSDTDGNLHEASIDCAAHRAITSGTGDGRYGPAAQLRRDQIATFLANTLRAAGMSLPDPANARDHYPDDEGNPHEDNINVLTEAGLIPHAGGRYRPAAPVARADMAVMVANALGRHHIPDGPAPDYFTDDDGLPDEPSIGRVAQEGVVTGKGGGRYAPDDTLRRDQMATFLVRLLDALA